MRIALLTAVLLVGTISSVFAQAAQTKALIGSGGINSAAGNVTMSSNVGVPVAGYAKESPYTTWAGFYGPFLTQLVGVDDQPKITFVSYLGQVTPNPARASAVIEFGNAVRQPVELAVYDLNGRRVRRLQTGDLSAGIFRISWDLRSESGHAVAPSIYFVRLTTRDFQRADRMVVIR